MEIKNVDVIGDVFDILDFLIVLYWFSIIKNDVLWRLYYHLIMKTKYYS